MYDDIRNNIKTNFELFNDNQNIIFTRSNYNGKNLSTHFVYNKKTKTCAFEKTKWYDKDDVTFFNVYTSDDNLQYANVYIDAYLAQKILIDIFGNFRNEKISGRLWNCSLIHNKTKICVDLIV